MIASHIETSSIIGLIREFPPLLRANNGNILLILPYSIVVRAKFRSAGELHERLHPGAVALMLIFRFRCLLMSTTSPIFSYLILPAFHQIFHDFAASN
jgi:hypothetical protein